MNAGLPPAVNPDLVHPGPRAAQRMNAVPTQARSFEITLRAGQPLEQCILEGFAAAGMVSGFAELEDLAFERLEYVSPARSDSPDRLAWYSAPRRPQGAAKIAYGYMSVGRHGAAGFTHCHGLWHLAGGRRIAGHLLSQDCIIARDRVIRATGFKTALFDRLPDPETGFEIFAAGGTPSGPVQAVALTLRPNSDVTQACAEICAKLGIQSGRIVGLGSLNGAGFKSGARMYDHASEFMVRRGIIQGGVPQLEILVVDSFASQFAGVLTPGEARVSITAELVILPGASE
ncbi:MAG: hypothetical protein ACSHWZ_11050 [Sulfitobacter sp.]